MTGVQTCALPIYRAQATPENTRDLSVSWERLGDIARARSRLDEAEQAYSEGKKLAEQLYRAQATPENTRDLWVSWERLGDIARARSRLDEAEAAYRAAVELWRKLQQDFGENQDSVRGEAVVLERLASVLNAPTQRQDKIEVLSRAASHWLRLMTAFPGDTEFGESEARVRAQLETMRAATPHAADS